jgi:hypothetical protein
VGSFIAGIFKTGSEGMVASFFPFFGVFSIFFVPSFFLSLGVVGDAKRI